MGNEMKSVKLSALATLVEEIFIAHNISEENARRVTTALINAELSGQSGHGLSRIASYAAQAKTGKVDGHAKAEITSNGAGFLRIDARHGFAYLAIDLAIEELSRLTKSNVIACAGIYNSHHCGQLAAHVEKLAMRGMMALMFANTPKAMAPWGGQEPLFGTNPIAFGAPRKSGEPIVIDLALSKIARGKIMAADKAGNSIPEGWALDENGASTTNPAKALKGSLIPMGDAKGSALALMVEILATSLVGAVHSFEASSFFEAEGAPPSVGQFLIAIDPDPVSAGGYMSSVEALINEILSQPGTRLPGVLAIQKRDQKLKEGVIEIPVHLYDELVALKLV